MTTARMDRLLIVDDEVELKTALCEMLNARGFEAVGCTSGQEALEALKEREFDLLLTDLMMPEMDGITLLKNALEMDPHLLTIIMTGQGTVQTAVDAMKSGAFDYVLKPFKLNTILPILSRALEVRRLRLENVQLRETVAIHELSMAIAYSLSGSTILNKLADAVLQQGNADELSIMLPTREGNELYVAVVRGEGREHLLGERVPMEGGIAGWVARHQQPVTLSGVVRDPRFTPLRPRADIRSATSMPMLVGGKLVGVLNVNAGRLRRPFTLGQIKAFSILASTAASALENAWLYGQVREAEEKYRSIFENSVEGIFRTTLDGRFTAVNPALARILGYDTPDDLIASIQDVSREIYVDPERRAELVGTLTKQGMALGFESQVYRKDGSVIWISENVRIVRDANGELFGYEGMVEDITERRRAQEALASRTRHLEAVRAVAEEITRELDLTKVLELITRRAAELLSAFCGVVYLWDEEAQALHPQAWHGLGDWMAEVRFALGEGIPGVVAAERKGMVVNDYRTSPIRHPLFMEQTGITASLAEPLSYRDRFIGVITINNERLGRRFTEEDQKLLALFASQASIAIENARLYRKLRKHAALLEQRVQERTQELAAANQQLEAASRHKSEFLANMSHELRTPLNSVIGFSELMLEQHIGSLNEKQARYLTHVRNSGRHLLNLINDILDLSKVEAGKLSLHPEPLCVPLMLEDILVIARGLAHKKAQTVQTEIEPELPVLRADPVRFKQILFNLLSNAVKFTPEHGVITVAARRVSGDGAMKRPGDSEPRGAEEQGSMGASDMSPLHPSPSAPLQFLEVRVSDTGAGIRAEDIPRLFREFTQLDTTRAQRHQGTGLGLALTKKLIEAHGGRIWAESDGEGRGSTFTVVLPVEPHEAGERVQGAEGRGQEAASGRQPAGGSRQEVEEESKDRVQSQEVETVDGRPLVLVVEHHAPVRELLGVWLADAGYRVEFAADGETAITKANAMRPVAITLEISLPTTDGFEVIAELKRNPATQDIPVLVVSAREESEIGFGLGVLDFLTKPVDRPDLLERLAQIALPHQATVLVVDDDPVVVRIVAASLRRAGYVAFEAHSGENGLAQALDRRPDLIILDLVMPDLSGFEVARRLREAPETRAIPIVVYTSKELSAEERLGLEQQIQGVVQKGRYSQEDLVREIRRLQEIGRRSGGNGERRT